MARLGRAQPFKPKFINPFLRFMTSGPPSSVTVNDNVAITESTTFVGSFSVNDTIGITEGIGALGSFSVNDVIAVTESESFAGAVTVNDPVSLSEGITATGSLSVNDTITTSENIALTGQTSNSDVVSVTEAQSFAGSVTQNDTIPITEGISFVAILVTGEVIAITEGLNLVGAMTVNDVIGVTDTPSAGNGVFVNDNITFVETITFAAQMVPIDEQVVVNEAQGFQANVIVGDTVSVAESVIIDLGPIDESPTGGIQLVLPQYPRTKSKRHSRAEVPVRARSQQADEIENVENQKLCQQILAEDDEITGIIISTLRYF